MTRRIPSPLWSFFYDILGQFDSAMKCMGIFLCTSTEYLNIGVMMFSLFMY